MFWPFRSRRSARTPGSSDSANQNESSRTPEQPIRRIAILGASGFDTRIEGLTVRCFPWSYKGETSSVADFDTAIVYLADAAPQDGFIALGLPKELDGKTISSLLSSANRLLMAGGEVVVIGRPDISYWGPGLFGHQGWCSMEWVGMRLEWDSNAGDRVELGDTLAEFSPYLSRLTRYQYSLTRVAGAEVYPPDGRQNAYGEWPRPVGTMEIVTQALLRTRHGGLVASSHLVSSPLDPPHKRPGRVVLLPPIPGESSESIQFLLREVYGVPVASPEAPWLSEIVAPGEAEINAHVKEVRVQIAELESRVRDLEEQRAAVRRPLRVLSYGDLALEEEVREALRQLGAEVEDPVEPNKEDGWISVRLPDQRLQGVLEIKSTQRAVFGEDGLKQLLEWRNRGLSLRGIEYKGIFVGNSAFGRPPSDRPDPFGANFRKMATMHDLVALTTATLLAELTRVVDEGVPHENFWRTLFATRGVYERG